MGWDEFKEQLGRRPMFRGEIDALFVELWEARGEGKEIGEEYLPALCRAFASLWGCDDESPEEERRAEVGFLQRLAEEITRIAEERAEELE